MAMQPGRRTTLQTRAWKGVRDVTDPYSAAPDFLTRAMNLYLAKPGSGAGFAARPGFILQNAAAPLGLTSDGRIGQGMCIATVADGSELNFVVNGGKLYRVSSDFLTYTDVTPGGISIDQGARVHLTPFSNRIAINDGVNTPWIASALESSPVTGTVITYSTAGAPWRAYGPAAVYEGTLFWLVRYRDTESRTARIAWSEVDDPLTGYFQTGFDNEWDVVEADTDTIWALWGTNTAIDYFRGDSIGYLSGTVGADFRTTATKDAIDGGVGTRSPQSIAKFGNWTYFPDTEGRVHRFAQGASSAEALWEQHGRVVKLAPTGWPDATARSSCAAIVPELDLYLVAIWSPSPGAALTQFPTTLYGWHAPTGRYIGEWTIGPGIAVHAIGQLVGFDGEKVLAVLGSAVAATDPQVLGAGGYLWTLASLADGVWTDNGEVPTRYGRATLGYDADMMYNVDQAVAIVEELETDPTAVGMTISAG